MHGLQSFVSTHSEESDSLLFILFAITNAFNIFIFGENSASPLEVWVRVFKVFTTATRKLGVIQCVTGAVRASRACDTVTVVARD